MHFKGVSIPTDNRQHLKLTGCIGASSAFVLSDIYTQAKAQVIVVTPDSASANALYDSLHAFFPALPVEIFPDWEMLPYDQFSAHQDITSARLKTLCALLADTCGIYIVPMNTLIHRLIPASHLQAHHWSLSVGGECTLASLQKKLVEGGYRSVNQVSLPGEFVVRGGVIDVYPNGHTLPVRIELFDDTIESLRHFDPETQRTCEKIEALSLIPAREYPTDTAGIATFRQQWHTHFEGDASQNPIYQSITEGVGVNGVEYYLPLFFEKMSNFLAYTSDTAVLVLMDDTAKAATRYWEEIQERYEQLRHDRMRPILAPKHLFCDTNELFSAFKSYRQIRITTKGQDGLVTPLPDLTIDNRLSDPISRLRNFYQQNPDLSIGICAESSGRRQVLLELFSSLNPVAYDHWHDFEQAPCRLAIFCAPMDMGFIAFPQKIALIAEAQLYGQRVLQRRRRESRATPDTAIADLVELSIGAPVVHYDHGIGRYQGLEKLALGDNTDEYLVLTYANDDKVYVPVSNLHLLSRYTGVDAEHAPLSKLGSDQWERAKRKAAEHARDVAAELLNIYAKRSAKPGFAFKDCDQEYAAFASDFPFEETPDQQQAITQTLQDMRNDKPMDRLVCGDVGFGKTEVAMRAAFMAVHSGKQVAALVPTTLLAQQHYETFCDRFAKWPVSVAVLSRFQGSKATADTIEKISAGKIDIVVGTHKLIQKDIRFANLGLVIVDEEHRFGVRQKEQFKSMRADVDFLTLTATPIPRTLNMALSSIRDLSIIATPPAKRLSVKTFVQEQNPILVREAILRELMRGGQVYYLHNNVPTIQNCVDRLAELVPEARLSYAHGQMRERELEQIMSDFYHQRANVLVCTTIIETGIDIPSANTIIIERADKLGLAQLHQLRGRVGRSHHQAYAYCFTPPPKQMTSDATKRLEALSSLEHLGAGFSLATHDLEIRGAGELLGEGQSGNLHSVGFSLYMSLLESAVKSLQSGQTINLETPLYMGAEVDLHLPCVIPDDYIGDIQMRLVLYKRIASAPDDDALESLQVEMIDRFGLLPPAVENLFKVTALKLLAQPCNIQKIEGFAERLVIHFGATATINAAHLIQMIQQSPRRFQLKGMERLTILGDFSKPSTRFEQLKSVLTKLKPETA